MNTYQGMPIQENSCMTDTVLIRMCQSKRRRIVKKWRKNKRNYKTVPKQEVFIFADPVRGKTIVCHPVVGARIREAAQVAEDRKQEQRILTMGPPSLSNVISDLQRYDRGFR